MAKHLKTPLTRVSPGSVGAALLLAILIFLATALVIAGASWAMLLYHLIVDGSFIVAWLAGAAGWGTVVLRGIAPSQDKDRASLVAVTVIALGLGFIGLATLALGLAGALNTITAVLLLAGGMLALVLLYRSAWAGLSNRIEAYLRKPAGWGWLWLSVMPLLGVCYLASLAQPGWLWRDEPNGYDVVEYHLQVPRQWYDAHRIYPLHENVFSYFPMGVEMHFLLAMHLHGGAYNAMYLCQLMHLVWCMLAVFAVRAVLGSGVGTVAGVLVAATPWVSLLAPIAYVEGGVLLYGTLCAGWVIRALDKQAVTGMVVAGAMAGLACGAKLTNVPMLLVAIPLAYFITLLVRRGAWRDLLLPPVGFVATGLAAFSPWLARTWLWTGNPVFPEAMPLLGRGHFSLVQMQRWINAYQPELRYKSASGHLHALLNEFAVDWRFGWLLVPLVLTAICFSWRNPKALFLAVSMMLVGAVWLLFTHLQSRFMVLEIPLAALLIGHLDWRAWKIGVGAASACLAIGATAWLLRRPDLQTVMTLDQKSHEISGAGVLGRFSNLRSFDPQMANDRAIYLVGDTYAYCYPVPSAQLHYRTVFDVDTTDPHLSLIQAWISAEGLSVEDRLIVIDPVELQRFARTYPPIARADNDEIRSLSSRSDVYIEWPDAPKPSR